MSKKVNGVSNEVSVAEEKVVKKNPSTKVDKVSEVKSQEVSKKIEEVKEMENIKGQEKVVEVAKKIKSSDFMNEEYMKIVKSQASDLLPETFEALHDKFSLSQLKDKDFELVMFTLEARKSYVLMIVNFSDNSNNFIGNYKSIMECKVLTGKLSALLGKELKIHYFKPGRKAQASEKISAMTYADKMAKYNI